MTSPAIASVIALVFAALIALALVPRGLAYAPGVAGVGLCAWLAAARGLRPAFDRRAVLAVAALLGLAALSALWSSDGGDAIERVLKAALVLGPGLCLWAVLRAVPADETSARFLLWPALAFVIVALVIAAELAANFPAHRLLNGLPAASIIPPAQANRTMVALALFLPLAVYGAFLARGRLVAALVALSFLPALLLTESQSAHLAALLTALCVVLPWRRRVLWAALMAAITIAIAAAPWLAPWLFTHAADMLAGNPVTGEGGGYAPHRLEIWDAVARQIHQSPLIGHGVEAVRRMEDLDMANLYHHGRGTLHPHNFALQFWVEFGAVGAAYVTALCALILRALYARRAQSAMRWVVAAFVVTIAVAAISYGVWQGWWLGLLVTQGAYALYLLRVDAAAKASASLA